MVNCITCLSQSQSRVNTDLNVIYILEVDMFKKIASVVASTYYYTKIATIPVSAILFASQFIEDAPLNVVDKYLLGEDAAKERKADISNTKFTTKNGPQLNSKSETYSNAKDVTNVSSERDEWYKSQKNEEEQEEGQVALGPNSTIGAPSNEINEIIKNNNPQDSTTTSSTGGNIPVTINKNSGQGDNFGGSSGVVNDGQEDDEDLDEEEEEDIVAGVTTNLPEATADEEDIEDDLLEEEDDETSDVSDSSNTDLTAPIVASDKNSGTYSSSLEVNLTINEPGDISFCIQSGGDCCGQDSEFTSYSEAIVIGESSGEFCLSYTGEDTSGNVSELVSQNFLIDSTLPNLSISSSKTFFQTNELSGSISISSSEKGKSGYRISQHNSKAVDPSSGECEDINTLFPVVSSGADITVNDSVESSKFLLDLVSTPDTIKVPLALSNELEYGENHFITVIENFNNSDGSLFGCQVQKITLSDFNIFGNMSGGTNPTDRLFGGFGNFGHFKTSDADTSESGSKKTILSDQILENSFVESVN
jgi:hypothetical protein